MNAKLCKAIRRSIPADTFQAVYLKPKQTKVVLIEGKPTKVAVTGTITLDPTCGRAMYKKEKKLFKQGLASIQMG